MRPPARPRDLFRVRHSHAAGFAGGLGATHVHRAVATSLAGAFRPASRTAPRGDPFGPTWKTVRARGTLAQLARATFTRSVRLRWSAACPAALGPRSCRALCPVVGPRWALLAPVAGPHYGTPWRCAGPCCAPGPGPCCAARWALPWALLCGAVRAVLGPAVRLPMGRAVRLPTGQPRPCREGSARVRCARLVRVAAVRAVACRCAARWALCPLCGALRAVRRVPRAARYALPLGV